MTTIATKFAAVALAAATLATASVATTTQAEARGGAFVAGLIGGTILGGVAAAHAYPYYYQPRVVYAPAPAYYAAPACQKVWVRDAYGNAYKQKVCN